MRRLVPEWCVRQPTEHVWPIPVIDLSLPSMSLDPLTQGRAKAMALRIVQFLAIMFTAIVILFGSAARWAPPGTRAAPWRQLVQ